MEKREVQDRPVRSVVRRQDLAALVEGLGLKRVREILGGKAKDELTRLIGEDNKLASAAKNISSVEKLARYYRWRPALPAPEFTSPSRIFR